MWRVFPKQSIPDGQSTASTTAAKPQLPSTGHPRTFGLGIGLWVGFALPPPPTATLRAFCLPVAQQYRHDSEPNKFPGNQVGLMFV